MSVMIEDARAARLDSEHGVGGDRRECSLAAFRETHTSASGGSALQTQATARSLIASICDDAVGPSVLSEMRETHRV